jgi:hypothetical protein
MIRKDNLPDSKLMSLYCSPLTWSSRERRHRTRNETGQNKRNIDDNLTSTFRRFGNRPRKPRNVWYRVFILEMFCNLNQIPRKKPVFKQNSRKTCIRGCVENRAEIDKITTQCGWKSCIRPCQTFYNENVNNV